MLPTLFLVALIPAATIPKEAVVATIKSNIVVIDTSLGAIKIELYPDKAPETVKNFQGYVDDKFYDNTVFHRVIKDFMIQGGGMEQGTQKEKKTRDPIRNEGIVSGLTNDAYTIAMARTIQPDSATSQFFINLKDNRFLNPGGNSKEGYCVFGKVIEGKDVVDKIGGVKVKAGPEAVKSVPVEEVVIKSIRMVKK